MADEAVLELHHLDDVRLIAVGSLAGVLPDQRASVAEVLAGSVEADALDRPASVGQHPQRRFEELTNLLLALAHP